MSKLFQKLSYFYDNYYNKDNFSVDDVKRLRMNQRKLCDDDSLFQSFLRNVQKEFVKNPQRQSFEHPYPRDIMGNTLDAASKQYCRLTMCSKFEERGFSCSPSSVNVQKDMDLDLTVPDHLKNIFVPTI